MGSGQKSGIETRITKQIRAQGAVTVADFMRLALSARELGYYSSRDPLGAAGDFTTAPEISQMFGEMIGLWCVDTWQRLGAPQEINLVELGPGRGSLMADALRAAKLAPDFLAAIRLHLVEISLPLRERQAANLQAFHPQWHDSIETLPAGPMLVVANEFFDALPIHQFIMTESGWRERGVTLGDDDRFAWTLLPPGPQLALLPAALRAASPGAISPGAISLGAVAECSPASQRILGILAQHCLRAAGAALFIDYGPAASGFGDTFQALKAHRYHDPLQNVGDADLTAHVDLPYLARLAQEAGCGSFGPASQGDFLRALGIETRAAMLSRNQDHVTQEEIQTALHRLIDAAQMGTLFKVVAITSPGITELAGFA